MLLDEYLQGDLSPNRLPPTWVSRTKFVFQSDDGGLAVYETTNNSVKTLVTNHTLVSRFFFLWLPECRYRLSTLVIQTIQQIYRFLFSIFSSLFFSTK